VGHVDAKLLEMDKVETASLSLH